jgi:hypothetical protein
MATLIVLKDTNQNPMARMWPRIVMSDGKTDRVERYDSISDGESVADTWRDPRPIARLIVLRDAIQDPVIFAIHSDWAILLPRLFLIFLSFSLPFYFGGLNILRIDVRIIVQPSLCLDQPSSYYSSI